jgi:NADPH:quinone reductase-like Zn-dependent oxidoreductase
MRAAIFSEFGGPEVLRLAEVETPVPGRGEVLVRVRAAALNHLDLWVRRKLPFDVTMPHIGGSDIAGEVAGLGDGVSGVAIGTRVVINPSLGCGQCEWCRAGEEPLCVDYKIIGEHVQGGFAEYVCAPAANLFPIPDGFSFEQAAAAPLVFLTAWRALTTRARLQKGETVLVTGASGGVASAAVQIAKYLGARVYAVTTTENVDRVRALGADVVYDRNAIASLNEGNDYFKKLFSDTGKRGVDVVIDSVGEATWSSNVRALARGGRMVVYGATTGFRADLDLRVVFWKQIEVIGTTMANRSEFEEVMRLVFSGALKPVVDVVLPLDQIRAAHERLEAGEHFGKIVVVP